MSGWIRKKCKNKEQNGWRVRGQTPSRKKRKEKKKRKRKKEKKRKEKKRKEKETGNRKR